MFSRKNVAPLVAEALGTAILTFSVLAITRSAIGIPYFIAVGVGLTLVLIVATLGATSGAHVNPAVTIGAWTLRKIKTLDALLYIIAQFAGAAAALRLYMYLTNRPIQNIANETFDWRVVAAEVAGTFVFTFGIAAATYQKFSPGKTALTIGGSLGLGVLVAGVASNGMLNPAVALGAQSWSMAYAAAPIVGSVVGMNVYALLFAGEKLSLVPATKKKAAKRKR